MTKQLIALAIAAAFGMAHAADTKPATDAQTSQSKVGGADAATGKSPEMKTESATNTGDKATHKKHGSKHTKKSDHAKAEPATPATPATPAEPAKK